MQRMVYIRQLLVYRNGYRACCKYHGPPPPLLLSQTSFSLCVTAQNTLAPCPHRHTPTSQALAMHAQAQQHTASCPGMLHHPRLLTIVHSSPPHTHKPMAKAMRPRTQFNQLIAG